MHQNEALPFVLVLVLPLVLVLLGVVVLLLVLAVVVLGMRGGGSGHVSLTPPGWRTGALSQRRYSSGPWG